MKLNEYQQLSKRTMNADQTREEKMINCALGITGEGGEVADIIKKAFFHGHGLNNGTKILLAGELGDVLFYISNMADQIGLTLEEVATMNVEKLMLRYPSGFSTEDSIKRVDTQRE